MTFRSIDVLANPSGSTGRRALPLEIWGQRDLEGVKTGASDKSFEKRHW